MINKKIQTKAQQTKVVNELVDDLRQKLDILTGYDVSHYGNVVRVKSSANWSVLITSIALNEILNICKAYTTIYPNSINYYMNLDVKDHEFRPCIDILVEKTN